MDREFLIFCRKWFEDYTSRIHCQDAEIEANIRLKLEHTYRVCENITIIALSQGVNREDLALAKAIALLHDVGRFEQLQGFGSFDDRKTLDHAMLGLKVINRSEILCSLPKRERNLIRKSIWHHNKYRIPVREKAEVAFFSKLIRDADKLDILRIITEHFERRDQHPNRALDLGLADEMELTKKVVSDFLQGKMVKISAMKTLGDRHLLYLGWVVDINFPITLDLMKEKGYLERLLADLSMEPEITQVRDYLQAYLEKRIFAPLPPLDTAVLNRSTF
ncbi:MAG: HD domain-containing protein [Methanothrix sp.]|nr:HD domain-containing protein [Methanothrix sp.]MDD4448110.1 HD domain-containing protein [Methanothrix sp.]